MLDENGAPVYNTVRDMLQSAMADALTYIDNYTTQSNGMHRQRVKVAEGQYRWVQGQTHDELNDAIVKAYIASGRISEFLPGVELRPSILTNFRELGEKWFTTYKTGLKDMSKKDYRYQLDKLLYPTFGDMAIQDIHLSDVQTFLNAHADTAKSTLRKSIIVLDQLFNLAIRDELMVRNPIDKKLLKYPSDAVQERNALDPQVFDSIIASIPLLKRLNDRRMLALFCFTGMRRGEVAGLRWEDIDMEQHVIHVTRNVSYPDNDPVVGTPKSKKGVRPIPIDPRLITHLAPMESEGFIFGGDAPLTRSAFMAIWAHIGAHVDLHGASCHIFRHTYATTLNNAGVDAKTIQTIMGHADISTTMNIYTHTNVGNVLDAGAKFEAITSTHCAQASQNCPT